MLLPTSQEILSSRPTFSVQQQAAVLPMQVVRHPMQHRSECAHETVAQRGLTVTWVIDEVRLAVQKGYEFFQIF